MDIGELGDPEDGYIEEGGSRNDDTVPHYRTEWAWAALNREVTVRPSSSKRAKKTGIERASFTDTFLNIKGKLRRG